MPHTETPQADTPRLKVLAATRLTQGQRADDFCFTDDGELVRLTMRCDNDGDDPDGFCGCARSWSGLTSHKGTTTAVVTEVAMTRQQYLDAMRASYEKAGMLRVMGWQTAIDEAKRLLEVAASRPVGQVVECRADEFIDRSLAGQVPSA